MALCENSFNCEDIKIFDKVNIYVEIINNNIEQNDLLDHILLPRGANLIKKLSKEINYIIFKDGKKKTVDYALNNKITMVNPLWIHDSVQKNQLLEVEKYLVKKTYTENHLFDDITNITKSSQNSEMNYGKKRKFNQLTPNKDTNEADQEMIMKRKKEENKSKTQIIELTNSKIKELKEIKPNNKITNFFKPTLQKEKENTSLKLEEESKIIAKENDILKESEHITTDLIKLSSINISEVNKHKILTFTKPSGPYQYLGESLQNINDSDYVIVNSLNKCKNDIKAFYSTFNNKKILDINFIFQNLNETINKETILIDKYILDKFFDLKQIDKETLPFAQNKYKIFIHPSIYDKDNLKKETFHKILTTLGVDEFVDNIRLSDICIINKEDANEYYPGHVKLLNQEFLFDCFYNKKIMDFATFKYNPEKINIKKK